MEQLRASVDEGSIGGLMYLEEDILNQRNELGRMPSSDLGELDYENIMNMVAEKTSSQLQTQGPEPISLSNTFPHIPSLTSGQMIKQSEYDQLGATGDAYKQMNTPPSQSNESGGNLEKEVQQQYFYRAQERGARGMSFNQDDIEQRFRDSGKNMQSSESHGELGIEQMQTESNLLTDGIDDVCIPEVNLLYNTTVPSLQGSEFSEDFLDTKRTMSQKGGQQLDQMRTRTLQIAEMRQVFIQSPTSKPQEIVSEVDEEDIHQSFSPQSKMMVPGPQHQQIFHTSSDDLNLPSAPSAQFQKLQSFIFGRSSLEVVDHGNLENLIHENNEQNQEESSSAADLEDIEVYEANIDEEYMEREERIQEEETFDGRGENELAQFEQLDALDPVEEDFPRELNSPKHVSLVVSKKQSLNVPLTSPPLGQNIETQTEEVVEKSQDLSLILKLKQDLQLLRTKMGEQCLMNQKLVLKIKQQARQIFVFESLKQHEKEDKQTQADTTLCLEMAVQTDQVSEEATKPSFQDQETQTLPQIIIQSDHYRISTELKRANSLQSGPTLKRWSSNENNEVHEKRFGALSQRFSTKSEGKIQTLGSKYVPMKQFSNSVMYNSAEKFTGYIGGSSPSRGLTRERFRTLQTQRHLRNNQPINFFNNCNSSISEEGSKSVVSSPEKGKSQMMSPNSLDLQLISPANNEVHTFNLGIGLEAVQESALGQSSSSESQFNRAESLNGSEKGQKEDELKLPSIMVEGTDSKESSRKIDPAFLTRLETTDPRSPGGHSMLKNSQSEQTLNNKGLKRLQTVQDEQNFEFLGLEEHVGSKPGSPNAGISNVNIIRTNYKTSRKKQRPNEQQKMTPQSAGDISSRQTGKSFKTLNRVSNLSQESLIKTTQQFWKQKFDQLLIEKKKWTLQLKDFNAEIHELKDENKIQDHSYKELEKFFEREIRKLNEEVKRQNQVIKELTESLESERAANKKQQEQIEQSEEFAKHQQIEVEEKMKAIRSQLVEEMNEQSLVYRSQIDFMKEQLQSVEQTNINVQNQYISVQAPLSSPDLNFYKSAQPVSRRMDQQIRIKRISSLQVSDDEGEIYMNEINSQNQTPTQRRDSQNNGVSKASRKQKFLNPGNPKVNVKSFIDKENKGIDNQAFLKTYLTNSQTLNQELQEMSQYLEQTGQVSPETSMIKSIQSQYYAHPQNSPFQNFNKQRLEDIRQSAARHQESSTKLPNEHIDVSFDDIEVGQDQRQTDWLMASGNIESAKSKKEGPNVPAFSLSPHLHEKRLKTGKNQVLKVVGGVLTLKSSKSSIKNSSSYRIWENPDNCSPFDIKGRLERTKKNLINTPSKAPRPVKSNIQNKTINSVFKVKLKKPVTGQSAYKDSSNSTFTPSYLGPQKPSPARSSYQSVRSVSKNSKPGTNTGQKPSKSDKHGPSQQPGDQQDQYKLLKFKLLQSNLQSLMGRGDIEQMAARTGQSRTRQHQLGVLSRQPTREGGLNNLTIGSVESSKTQTKEKQNSARSTVILPKEKKTGTKVKAKVDKSLKSASVVKRGDIEVSSQTNAAVLKGKGNYKNVGILQVADGKNGPFMGMPSAPGRDILKLQGQLSSGSRFSENIPSKASMPAKKTLENLFKQFIQEQSTPDSNVGSGDGTFRTYMKIEPNDGNRI